MSATLDALIDRLSATGLIRDRDSARRRVVLGYPVWLVLSELTPVQLREHLTEFTGIQAARRAVGKTGIDIEACEAVGPDRLQEMRWLPLRNGSVAVADPFRPLPDGDLAGRPLCIAGHDEIDAALEAAFPDLASTTRQRRRLGRYLLEAGAVDEQGLAEALQEQVRHGGRLGEILVAHGIVEPAVLASALAGRIGLESVVEGAHPAPLLPRTMAHELRAVAVDQVTDDGQQVRPVRLFGPVKVAFSDPTEEKLAAIEAELGRPVEAQVTDDETLDALLASVYAEADIEDVISGLREQTPHLSAFRTRLSGAQVAISSVFVLLAVIGFLIDTQAAAIWVVGLSTVGYCLYTSYRLYSAWKGWQEGSTINPTQEDLAAMDGRDLPSYTVLLPVFREKPETLTVLFAALSALDYPKHKLNGMLLVESDDQQTQAAEAAMESVRDAQGRPVRPGWLKTLLIPPGGPRTKPKAMIYGLLYASGDLLTIFDAEDHPEPDQLKKAAWAFERAAPNVACIQAKLSYYNSRQNLLTRWFTLEYAAWFDTFLPGLHAMDAPIPLGGTSNHFRLSLLKEVLSWDPYNVTEDADLGLRFTRAGYRTQMLESTTYEEANSRFVNWLRQRSRWIKGYMQTFLVHTRHPLDLYRELGAINTAHFMATVGGLIFTVLISPMFWLLLGIWLVFQPGWIPALFPGPVYYLAMTSLVVGNFFFVFLALIGAVGRGQDDLSPYTLIFPVYWLMMSIAGYFALYELIVKPHYWQKTEHGLHLAAAAKTTGVIDLPPPSDEEDARKAA